MIGYTQITKREFYLQGGFAHPRCVRVTRSKFWAYFWRAR